MSDQNYDPTAVSYGVEEAATSGGQGLQLVYKDGVRHRFFNKEGASLLYIMPAFGSDYATNPQSWQPYRTQNLTGNPPQSDRFTNWVRPLFYFPFVGGKINIISPKTLDPNVRINVLQQLWDVVRSTPEWRPLAGLDPNSGKKPQNRGKDDFRNDKVRPETTAFIVNAVNPHRVTENEADVSCLYEIPKNAFAGSGKPEEKDWGLMAKLNMENLDVPPGTKADDYAHRYYWGDITDPTLGFRPVTFFKKTPPNGGLPIWTAEPVKAARVPYSPKFLEGRYKLFAIPNQPSELFLDISQAEVLDHVMSLFAGYPKLLRQAFESTFPGFGEKLTKLVGAISGSTVHQAGTDFASGAPSAPAASAAAPAQQFAPQSGALKEYWATVGGKSVKLNSLQIQEIVDKGQSLQVQDLALTGWKDASAFGFAQDAIPDVPAPAPAPDPVPAPAAAPAPPPAASAPALSLADLAAPAAVSAPPASTAPAATTSVDIQAEAARIQRELMGTMDEPAPATGGAVPPPPAP